MIQCGTKSLPISAFIRLDDIRRGWHRSTSQYVQLRSSLIPDNPFSAILTDFPEEIQQLKTGQQSSLQSWITATEHFHATDPRDKIYALLSLAPPSQVAHVVPDYTASVADVYSRVTARCITHFQDLSVLHFDVDGKSAEHKLPSWVRDYSSSGNLGDRPTYVSFLIGAYAASGRGRWGKRNIFVDNDLFSDDCRQLRGRGIMVDRVVYAGRNERIPAYTGVDAGERLANIKQRAARTLANVGIWEARVGEIEGGVCGSDVDRRVAFWRTLMAGRQYDKWAPLPTSMSRNEYFEVWMGRASVSPSVFKDMLSSADIEEAERLYVKPFTDTCITHCHGRSFIITSKGYIGLAPLKTEIGDEVIVLEGGNVPFVLRVLVGGGYQLIGEAYVNGIMEGEAIEGKRPEDMKIVVLK